MSFIIGFWYFLDSNRYVNRLCAWTAKFLFGSSMNFIFPILCFHEININILQTIHISFNSIFKKASRMKRPQEVGTFADVSLKDTSIWSPLPLKFCFFFLPGPKGINCISKYHNLHIIIVQEPLWYNRFDGKWVHQIFTLEVLLNVHYEEGKVLCKFRGGRNYM